MIFSRANGALILEFQRALGPIIFRGFGALLAVGFVFTTHKITNEERAGTILFEYSVAQVLAGALALGLPTALARGLRGVASPREMLAQGWFATVSMQVSFLAIVICAWLLNIVFGLPINPVTLTAATCFGQLALVATAFQSLGKTNRFTFLLVILPSLAAIFWLMLEAGLGFEFDESRVALIASASSAFLGTVWFYGSVSRPSLVDRIFTVKNIVRSLNSGMQFFPSQFGGYVFQWGVPILMMLSLGDGYQVFVSDTLLAQRIAGVVGLWSVAVNGYLLSRVSNNAQSAGLTDVANFGRFTSVVGFYLSLLYAMSVIALVAVFPALEISILLVTLFLVAQIFNCACGPVVLFLNMLDLQKLGNSVVLLSLILFILCGLVFGSYLGALGVVIAFCVAVVVQNFVARAALKQRTNLIVSVW